MSTQQNGLTTAPLIVVGMHRSGTSFVASLLHAAGVDMGSRLMPAARGNERGHFENMDFVEFHMHELRLTGHDDAGWAARHPLTLSEEAASKAHDILAANAQASAWGWKDPRTTLFLDYWSSVVPDAKYLFIYREPSEVIDSLYRRGDESIRLSPELAARAYLLHNEVMLRHAHLHRARSIIANVSAIAHDPRQFLAAIVQKLGVDLNVHAHSTFEGALMRTIAPEAPRAALLRQLVPEIDRLYSILEQEADFPSPTGGYKRTSVPGVKEAFFNDWLQERNRETELTQRDADLQAARAALSAVEASLTERDAQFGEAQLLHALERTAHEAELQHLRDERDEHIAEIGRLHATIADIEQRLEHTTRELIAQTDASIAATRAESDRVAFLIATVQSSSFWKIKRGVNRMLAYLGRR